jgi:type II secretory pathway pseudopilin PulG
VRWVVRGRAGRRRLGGVAMVVVVLLAGGLATAGAASAVRRGQQQLAVQAMDHYITDLSEVIEDEVGHYQDALADLAAAVTTQPALTADGFAAMTARFTRQRLPGASGVSFVVPAYDRQAAATEALWRTRGATGLTLYRTGTAESRPRSQQHATDRRDARPGRVHRRVHDQQFACAAA